MPTERHVVTQAGCGASIMKIIVGNPDSDAGWLEIDTDTGEVTTHPGNRGGGPDGFYAIKETLGALKHAAMIPHEETRKAMIRAAGEYLRGQKSEILSPFRTVVAIF